MGGVVGVVVGAAASSLLVQRSLRLSTIFFQHPDPKETFAPTAC